MSEKQLFKHRDGLLRSLAFQLATFSIRHKHVRLNDLIVYFHRSPLGSGNWGPYSYVEGNRMLAEGVLLGLEDFSDDYTIRDAAHVTLEQKPLGQ